MGRKKRGTYDAQFKREAVQLTEQPGRSVKEVAEQLGIHPIMLSKWRSALRVEGGEAFRGCGQLRPEVVRVRELEREVARLREERDILKKAVGFFSRDAAESSSSSPPTRGSSR